MLIEQLLSMFDTTETIKNLSGSSEINIMMLMSDPTKINKTIREIRKENYDVDKILRDIWPSIFEPDENHYKPMKTVNTFNNYYIQHESIGDKNKTLRIKEYLDMIRPYVNDTKVMVNGGDVYYVCILKVMT